MQRTLHQPFGRAGRTDRRAASTAVRSVKQYSDPADSVTASWQERDNIRIAIPSKGRMSEATLQLLKDCQLDVKKVNPRQYVASISQLPGVEVWFQRASDVVRRLQTGDVDLGIVGYDMFYEFNRGSKEVIVIHDALGFGKCHLGLGVPTDGKFANVNTIDELLAMDCWGPDSPLRVVTGYQYVAQEFFKQLGFEHVQLCSADGALEAAPKMGYADIILDLVSTGTTLRENNLKQIAGATMLQSQGCLVGNKKALQESPELLATVKELIERLDAHLTAEGYYSVIVNMQGESAKDVAARLLSSELLSGLSGPTVSPVYTKGEEQPGLYAAVICVPKKELYPTVKELRACGGSGVLVQPMTYIFDEEPPRWKALLETLGISDVSA
ncbi:unnamed protein product [Pedinophyceae sp. YPF-701]|nr:unnamed protein product [Pedinophyceae sp. YPF-701]